MCGLDPPEGSTAREKALFLPYRVRARSPAWAVEVGGGRHKAQSLQGGERAQESSKRWWTPMGQSGLCGLTCCGSSWLPTGKGP
jgi:hypothetical protein